MKIQIKNRYDGSIIFEHECENNTIKKTVKKAVRNKISLSGSNLRNSNLSGSIIPIFSKWATGIIDTQIIKIGCKEKTIKDWDLFFASEEEFDTKRGTQEFKQIEAIYLAHKAYLTHLNS